jgi:ABC-type sugar transport system ATPase subunit
VAYELQSPQNWVSRVALARAVYSPAKYVLLDDPLSAVVCGLDEGAAVVSDNGEVTGQPHCTILI